MAQQTKASQEYSARSYYLVEWRVNVSKLWATRLLKVIKILLRQSSDGKFGNKYATDNIDYRIEVLHSKSRLPARYNRTNRMDMDHDARLIELKKRFLSRPHNSKSAYIKSQKLTLVASN